MPSEPATNPIVQGTKRASAPPPPRPVTAPRVSSALAPPAALASRAGVIETRPPQRVAGETLSDGTETTAVVEPLPLLESSAPAGVVVVGRDQPRHAELGKWLIGGAVVAGAFGVALLSGAFDRHSGSEDATAAPPIEQFSPREKPDEAETPDPPGESQPPQTVSNAPPSAPADATSVKKPAEPATPAVPETSPTAKIANEPPETPTQAAAATTGSVKKAGKSRRTTKSSGTATKSTRRNRPATRPATPPKWDPEELFPKQD